MASRQGLVLAWQRRLGGKRVSVAHGYWERQEGHQLNDVGTEQLHELVCERKSQAEVQAC